MTTLIAVAQLNELLAGFHPIRCWRFGRYLGSMLILDFGDQIDIKTHDSTTVAEGGLMIGIRSVLWVAIDGERTITTAEDVDHVVFANDLERRPIGAALQMVESTADGRWIVFRFDNGFALKVDAVNTWKTESDIFEITVPDGRIVVLDEKGAIEVLDEIEPIRAERWRARLS